MGHHARLVALACLVFSATLSVIVSSPIVGLAVAAAEGAVWCAWLEQQHEES